MRRLLAMLSVSGCAILFQSATALAAGDAGAVSAGAPVAIPRSTQYDLRSRINGQTYRIMVSTPFKAEPDTAYPVLYVLDGNQYFGTATETLTRQSALRNVAPAIVVGISYPTDDPTEVFRLRAFDLTPFPSPDPKNAGRFGGGDAFLRVLEEEIRPFVTSRYKVDGTRQIIWGQSFAGLTVLRALFRNPTSFSTYVLSSPSIWFSNKDVLKDEESFSKRARDGELRLKILITSAGDEQYRGSDPKRLAEDNRMVDNASDLAQRLSSLNAQNVIVVRTIFEGEIHNTVSPASISRTLRFALPLN